jgi:DNA-binding beta-propeller fold protein YncE
MMPLTGHPLRLAIVLAIALSAAPGGAGPKQKGGQEQTGHYQPVAGWPKALTSLPGHENWTWGAVEGVFAETPNRIYVLQRGELPALARPANTPVPRFGPSLSFPVAQAPFRNASLGPVASGPGGGPTGTVTGEGFQGREGVDYRWEHTIYVVDGGGNIIETWSQWDSLLRRPHAVHVNPYDPQKHVWVVDDARCQVYKFTHDGKRIALELGTRDTPGSDDRHFDRPTFLAWLPDGTMFVADGYNGSRVAKFDKNGRFLSDWGRKGEAGRETRPGYFNGVHGIAVDPVTRLVYVNDRENRRIQVFRENGEFVDQWRTGDPPSHIYSIYISADRFLWGSDAGTHRLVKWDLKGEYRHSFGYQGDAPGSFWGVHQFSVDQDGNLYVAEVAAGRLQKFRPMPAADPAKLVGKPVYSAWKD